MGVVVTIAKVNSGTGYPCFCNADTPTSGCDSATPTDAVNGWNDNHPKGQFCIVDWTFDFRDVAENARIIAGGADGDGPLCEADPDLTPLRPVTHSWKSVTMSQECIKFVPCCPAVVFITPNGETSSNSNTYDLPTLGLDDKYGAQVQRCVMAWMTDPLWQQPARPCDLDLSVGWAEDDGSGNEDTDTVSYYAQRPWEECMTQRPTGPGGGDPAPALPSGCYLGCISVDDLNAGVTAGNTLYPPQAGQCFQPFWAYAENRLANIARGGRFSDQYADPMAIPDEDTELQPA